MGECTCSTAQAVALLLPVSCGVELYVALTGDLLQQEHEQALLVPGKGFSSDIVHFMHAGTFKKKEYSRLTSMRTRLPCCVCCMPSDHSKQAAAVQRLHDAWCTYGSHRCRPDSLAINNGPMVLEMVA